MNIDRRQANKNWCIVTDENTWSDVMPGMSLAVLMDIRDELQRLNRLLHCSNFVAIPTILRRIDQNAAKKKAPKARKSK